MVNWTALVGVNANAVEQFAQGKLSGREFYNFFRRTEAGGIVRSLLRNRGVVEARVLARKALRRRTTSA